MLYFLYIYIFSREEIFNFQNPSADILFQAILLDYSKYEENEPLKGIRRNQNTILNSKFNDACCDDNGAYINSRSTKKMYHVDFDRSKNEVSS